MLQATQQGQLYTVPASKDGTPTTRPLRVHVVYADAIRHYESATTKRQNRVVEAIIGKGPSGPFPQCLL